MISQKILKLLQNSKKTYFPLAELAAFSGASVSTIKVTVSRLVKQGKISRLARGYYCSLQKPPDLEQFAVEIGYPAYLSLESALAAHGLLNQVPATITLVTTNRSNSLVVKGANIEYSHFKPELYFGYSIRDHIQIAKPEKALLDELYLVGLKKRTLDFKELNLKGLNLSLLKRWLKAYPLGTTALAKKLNII